MKQSESVNYIRKIRIEKKLSQDDFARELGICKEYLSALENDKRKPSERLHKQILTFAGTEPKPATLPEITIQLLYDRLKILEVQFEQYKVDHEAAIKEGRAACEHLEAVLKEVVGRKVKRNV